MTQEQDVGGAATSEALAGGLRVGSGGRHRRHVFPGRDNVVKVRCADEERPPAVPPVVPQLLGGWPVVVAWSVGKDQAVLEELVQARLALRRYGVNVNQAVAALNSGGQVPVWLEQAVAGSDRAVARVDAATAVLTRRLV